MAGWYILHVAPRLCSRRANPVALRLKNEECVGQTRRCIALCASCLLIVVCGSRDEFDAILASATDEKTGMVDYLAMARADRFSHFQEVSE